MSKKKRVVQLINGFNVGGAQQVIYELTKNLDSSQFEACALSYMAPCNTDLEKKAEAQFSVVHLNESGHIGVGEIWRVVKAVCKMKPDVVHAHMGGAAFGAIWAILSRKRFVVTVHTRPDKAFSSKIEKLLRIALRTGRTTLVAVSKENQKLMDAYFGISGKQTACVNNGIDISRFYRNEHSKFTLINVAHHDENKNQAALIRCFARFHADYPDTRLLLLGDGPTHAQLIEQVKELNLSECVEFTGNVPNTEDYYAMSDLYVQTSHREAMPMSVLEAMASGLPVVSTNVGGLSDVVQDNGILVPDNDEEALYRAIIHIYQQSAEDADRMSKASRRIVQSYSSENMAREYEKIYSE